MPSDTVVVGLGADPKWADFIEVVEGYVPSNRERVVFGGLNTTCRDIATTQLEQWGEAVPDAELAALFNLMKSDVGGLIFTEDGTQSSIWSGAQDDGRIRQTALETVAAALLMYGDVDARADAACVNSIQTITVPRRRGVPKHDIDVQVIDVRRRADSGSPNKGDPTTRDFRWVTRGHYRTYWTGEGRTIKRRRWVSEYINGPEDAPMRNPKRVYRIGGGVVNGEKEPAA
jgi:hypothetical protein